MQMSNRISGFQCSPIRRLVPYSRDAVNKGIHVIHLNIGQPDIKTPVEAIKAIQGYNEEYIAYGTADDICLAARLLYLPYRPKRILVYLAVGYRMLLLRIYLRDRNASPLPVILIPYEHRLNL